MKDAKRALFVSYNAATEPLVKSQVLPYLAALSKDGIKFTLLTFEKDDADYGAIPDELNAPGIEWIRMRFHSRPLFIAKPFDIVRGICNIWRLCALKKFEVVHCRAVMAAVMALVPARLTGARLIFDMKSSLAEAYRLSGRLKAGSILHKALSFLEKQCVLNADEVILETRTHKEFLEKSIGGRKRLPNMTVIPCCVDTGRFCGEKHDKPVSPAERPRIVYLGSLSGWYLIPEMLDFFEVFKHNYPQAECIFLTDDKDGILARLAAEKRIEGVRAFTVPYEDVCRELARSTAGILFKHPNDRLDSFPIKVGEYLASGLPIIINHGMGDVETLVSEEKVGVIVKSCDKPSYSDAVNALTVLLKEGVSLKKRCADTANRRLSLSSGLERYKSVYARLAR